jgi:hypothetical protein
VRGRPLLSLIVVVALTLVALGCGRTQLSPWGTPFDGGATGDTAADLSPADGPAASDGPSGDAGDAGPIAFSCAALAGVAVKGPLTTRHTRQALFTADGSTLLLRVAGEGGATSDDLLIVSLPSGSVGTAVQGITSAEWLGATGRVLLTRPGAGALTALALDGSLVRTLIGASCEHVIAPDGGRVYALTTCDAAGTAGVLVVIDVVTGTTTTLSAAVLRQTLVVSPDSKWVAYQLGPSPGDGGAAATGTIQLFSRDNAGYTLAYLAGTRRPTFTPANDLLFVTATDASPLAVADIYRHVPGTGTSVARVAASRNVGSGYHVSPDAALLLAARFPPASPMLDELYAVHLDGSGETLVASNLAPYQLNQSGPSVFAFSADGQRVIYTSDNFSGTDSVAIGGGTITPLASGGTFGISPAGDRIAVIERVGPNRAVDTLHLIDAVTSAEKIKLDAATIDGLTFAPAGGVLFVEVPDVGQRRLRHFKYGGSAFTTLAQWNVSQYWTPRPLFGELPASAGYPTDPTGCYAVVDSDTTTPAGTSLVLLP